MLPLMLAGLLWHAYATDPAPVSSVPAVAHTNEHTSEHTTGLYGVQTLTHTSEHTSLQRDVHTAAVVEFQFVDPEAARNVVG